VPALASRSFLVVDTKKSSSSSFYSANTSKFWMFRLGIFVGALVVEVFPSKWAVFTFPKVACRLELADSRERMTRDMVLWLLASDTFVPFLV